MDWQTQFIYFKFWFQRSLSYMGIFQFMMIAYLFFIKVIPPRLANSKTKRYCLVLLVLVIFALAVLAGYLEDRLGLAGAEFELNARKMGLLK